MHGGDRRLLEMSLTDEGRALMARIEPIARAYEAELLDRLGADAHAFCRAIERLMPPGAQGVKFPD